jgi:hypothetical protein
MHVSDQYGGFCETRGCKENGGGWEGLDSVAQRPHEPFHRLAKELIVLDDCDHGRRRYSGG